MEEWRDVPGYNGRYQISIGTKEGRCRNTKTGRILSNNKNKRTGYVFWELSGVKHQAAKWIAFTYPELVQNEWFEGAEIDHIDTDRMNNQPSNLRWTDDYGQQNNPLTKIHREEGLKKYYDTCPMMRDQKNRKDLSKWVIQLSLNNEILHFYPSAHQVERETGIPATRIAFCCRNNKTAGGFKWRYAEITFPGDPDRSPGNKKRKIMKKILYTIGLVLSLIFVNSTAKAQYAYDVNGDETPLVRVDKATLMANPEYATVKELRKDGTKFVLIGLGIQAAAIIPIIVSEDIRYFMTSTHPVVRITSDGEEIRTSERNIGVYILYPAVLSGFVLEGIGFFKFSKADGVKNRIKMQYYGTSASLTYNF